MKKVAIQGIKGSYHDIAIREFFKNEDVNIVCCTNFKNVFESVKNGESLGIVAVENTIAGSIMQNYNHFKEEDVFIFGEIKLRISHCLAALPGQHIEDIKEIYSHPIALRQCEDFLEKRNWSISEGEDTASSAKEIADKKIKGRAAICSTLAAKEYNLEILETSIETNKHNFTRFLLFSDRWDIDQYSEKVNTEKASLVFSMPHETGALSQILSILSFYENNLTKMQSTPIVGREWEYMFFVDLTYKNYIKYKQSLDAIRPLTKNLKILGEYKIGKQIK